MSDDTEVKPMAASHAVHPQYARGWNAALEAMAPELERLRADARRLDWVQSVLAGYVFAQHGISDIFLGWRARYNLRAAIDAAQQEGSSDA